MFHANTQRVISDWAARRGDRLAPARADIEPGIFREILPQLFILGLEPDGTAPFRLAGGLVSELHARDLRGVCFFSLWMGSDRLLALDAFETAAADASPVVLEGSAWTAAGASASLEIVLAPLLGTNGAMDRVLGFYQPTSSVHRLMGAPIEALTLHHARTADPDLPVFTAPPRRPRLRLAAVDGRRLD